jgi:PAS domain S-box-containing protein
VVDVLALDGEERVRLALASARIGVWEWDLNTDDVRWSSTTPLAFGLTPDQAPKNGRAFFELVHPGDRHAIGESCNQAIRERRDLAMAFRTMSSDGIVRWVQAHGRVLYDGDGTACQLRGVNIDISDLKSFDEQLFEARGEAERLKILKATMRTVQDIVGNALMSLQLFRRDAEQPMSVPAAQLFDQVIAETAAKLQALADLELVVDTEMIMGSAFVSGSPAEKPYLRQKLDPAEAADAPNVRDPR